jgi:hypothetical protein
MQEPLLPKSSHRALKIARYLALYQLISGIVIAIGALLLLPPSDVTDNLPYLVPAIVLPAAMIVSGLPYLRRGQARGHFLVMLGALLDLTLFMDHSTSHIDVGVAAFHSYQLVGLGALVCLVWLTRHRIP